MISFDECLEKGLIKRIPSSDVQARSQMEKAHVLLAEAKTAVSTESPNSAVLSGYAAMFDSARAVLFKDGYRERSHACVARYLESRYSEEIGMQLIHLLDEYRDKRHKVSYSSEYYPTMEEARNLVNFAEQFLKKIETLF